VEENAAATERDASVSAAKARPRASARPTCACFRPVFRPPHLIRLLLLLTAVPFVGAATRPPDGRRIFLKQCSGCHGAKGEGVKDKYGDPLVGDWSVAKLARYIASNMPDDKPETLAPAEADAVARYIHDAFYSRAAQARIHPTRIELAHLTNRQYLVTVADLLRSVGGPEGTASDPAELGLKATYYNAAQRGRFDAAKIVHRNIDPGIDFDFAEGTAARERLGAAAEFSMQWRGAVLADETGDYEFVVRTPNSIRVWINSEFTAAEATIDVNVSTPEDPITA
jgi:hypothetical protein